MGALFLRGRGAIYAPAPGIGARFTGGQAVVDFSRSGGGMSNTGDGKRGIFDDLAGMASGAVSIMAGARAEAEAMMRAQVEAMVQRLELVKREELDAALEVARRAREQAEALEIRVAALEARLASATPEA